MGFGALIESRLRGKLRDWAEDLSSERRLKEGPSSTLHPFGVCGTNTLSARRNLQSLLWEVVMFQAWWLAQGRSQPALAATLMTALGLA
jgi:asparagine synthase (glutamine-hydrolysing)